jgi:hypothetical protein
MCDLALIFAQAFATNIEALSDRGARGAGDHAQSHRRQRTRIHVPLRPIGAS